MHIEIRPLGVKCNIACNYCYQTDLRKEARNRQSYDLDSIKRAAEIRGTGFTLFGGEPLLIPKLDLEDLFSWGLEKFGGSSIQTNGTLIDTNHIELFKRYRVAVGISVDGPGDLNQARWAGSSFQTTRTTEKTLNSINLLVSSDIIPSLIVTLNRYNADNSHLPHLREWFVELDRIGIKKVRIHLLEIDSPEVRANLSLTTDENVSALLSLDELERESLKNLRFDIFQEIEEMLLSVDSTASCVWRACDPYTTGAVQGIDGFGESTNCGRTNKAGVDFIKADTPGFERYIALYHTSYVDGGCQGCRFFLICKGQCPGTAIDNDWRNRSEHCTVWLEIFKRVEQRLVSDGKIPLSMHPDRVKFEQRMVQGWISGRNHSLEQIVSQ